MTLHSTNASSGVISAACLNLPANICYKHEYMYLSTVIPGPNEPHLTELNHYIRPVVDQFLVSWEWRIYFTQTGNHPTGQDTCSTIANVVCDLPAACKCNQSAGHSSHFLCTRCDCYHIEQTVRIGPFKIVLSCAKEQHSGRLQQPDNLKRCSFLKLASIGVNYGTFHTGIQLSCWLLT